MLDEAIGTWLGELADRQPTPGGGAVAALSAALSAALIGMVTSYTTGPKWADVDERMQAVNKEAAELRAQAVALIQEDTVAFTRVGTAYGLPKTTPKEKQVRQRSIQAALVAAAKPPRVTAGLALRLVAIAEELVDSSNPNVISDVAVAASTARAALEAAIVNIEINEQLITDEQEKDVLKVAVTQAELAIKKAAVVVQRVRESMGKS